MSLLIFKNIEKEYKNQKVLNGINLRIEKGDRIALMGQNGSGKSTLLKIAMGLEEADLGEVVVARNIKVAYLSQDMVELKEEADSKALEYKVVLDMEKKLKDLEALLAQNNLTKKEYDDAFRKYSRALEEFEALDGYIIDKKIKKILMGLGIKEETLEIPMDKLSGGEKMRVALARMLLKEPDLIILDEPTNHLDLNGIEWLESYLKKFDGGVIFVSHDRYFLDNVATRVAEIHMGTVVERNCNYTSFRLQKDRIREYVQKEKKTLTWKIKEMNRVNNALISKGKIKAAKSREKTFKKAYEELENKMNYMIGSEHLKDSNMNLKFKEIRKVSKDIVRIEGLKKRFGGISIFNDANLHIRGGERVAIIGPNGSGKTTLIKMLLGEDKDFIGKAELGYWVKYSYLSQEIWFEDDSITIREEILRCKDMKDAEVREFLAKFRFYGEDIDKKLNVLSGGEKVRVYLAKIIIEEADCLIMDEPTNHLDIASREEIEKALNEFKGTVIAISHDRYFLKNCITRIVEITREGKIASYNGNYDFYKADKEKKEFEEKVKENLSVKNISKKRDYVRVKDKNIEELEHEIIKLEEEAKRLEAEFNEKTGRDKYERYSTILEKIEILYEDL